MQPKKNDNDVAWAANAKAPLTRDQQIEFMKGAAQRRNEMIDRHSKDNSDVR